MFNYFYDYSENAENFESSTKLNLIIALGIALLVVAVLQDISGPIAVEELIDQDIIAKLLSNISFLK